MPEGGSNAGLGIEAGLGFGEGSRFEVGFGLGPRWFQAPNPQHGSGIPERLSLGHKGRCRQDPSFAAKATHVVPPVVEETSRILSGAAARPGKRHGELSDSLPSQPALLLDLRRVKLSDVGFGSP